MGKKRDRWYERQIEAARQDKEDASKPLSEKTVRSKETEVPFVPRKVDKPRGRAEEERTERERASEWIREMEEEWEQEQDRVRKEKEKDKGKGKAIAGEDEEGPGSDDRIRPDFAMMWEEHRSVELMREAEGKNDWSGLGIKELVASGKIPPSGPLDDMDKELLAQESGSPAESDVLFVPQVDMDIDEEDDDVIMVEARTLKGKERAKEW